MPITATDIVFYQSATGLSDGGAESATEIVSGVNNNLWPNISDALRAADGTRYKKFFIRNENTTETMTSPAVWCAIPPPGITVNLGLGASSVDDDDNTQGNMTAWTANAVVAMVSTASDTRTATVYGLNASGDPVTESFALTGTTEKLSTNTYSKVWSVQLSAVHGSNIVTVKQGAGGTTRGTLGANQIVCWLWVNANSRANGIYLPNVLPTTAIPIWCRQTWTAGVSAQRPTSQTIAIEEVP